MEFAAELQASLPGARATWILGSSRIASRKLSLIRRRPCGMPSFHWRHRHPAAQSREVWLRFRGLPFARWDDGRVFFGINDAREELTPASRPALKHLLHDLEVRRHPLASDTRHSLYRVQPERWPESIVREDVTHIDAMLDQRASFCQCRGRTRHSRSSCRDLFQEAGGHRTKGWRAHPSAAAGSGLLVVRSSAVAERRDRWLWLFSRGRFATGTAARLSRCTRPAIPSGNGRSSEISLAGT